MKRVTLSLIAATAFATGASPVLAQDSYALPPPPPVATPQTDYSAAPETMPVQAYPATPTPAPQVQYQTGPVRQYGYVEPQYALSTTQQPAAYGGLPPVPSIGYTQDQRDAWLADCRQQYSGSKKKGGLIGGLLGAIGGGIAGHELTDGSKTRRLGGTLIGAGVGGLVGAAIGSAIGGAADRKDMDECEAYLQHYTGGYQYGNGYGYGYGYGGYVTVMVPVQVQGAYTYSAPTRHETSYVVEEVIEEKVDVPQTKYVKAVPVTKYVKTAPTTKYVKQGDTK